MRNDLQLVSYLFLTHSIGQQQLELAVQCYSLFILLLWNNLLNLRMIPRIPLASGQQ